MTEVIFSKYSNDRDAKFNIVTEVIKKDTGEKYVVKRPFTKAAEEHVSRILDHCQTLRQRYQGTPFEIADAVKCVDAVEIPWIEGAAFSEYLDELLTQGKRDAWTQLVKKYFEHMFAHKKSGFVKSTKFELVFGNIEAQEEEAISNVDVDMLFSNVIYKENKWFIYDFEWTVDFEIPVKFLMYRCLYYYMSTQARSAMLLEGIFEEFGITKDQCALYENMENNFQKYIEGNHVPMWRLYRDVHGAVVDMRSLQERFVLQQQSQIFYDVGEGFSEDVSKMFMVYPDAEKNFRLQLTVPPESVCVRFDPVSCACLMKVESIMDAHGNLLDYKTNGREIEEKTYLFLHGDPQILFEKNFGGDSVEIKYQLEILEENNESALAQINRFVKEQEKEKKKLRQQEQEAQRREQEARRREQEAQKRERGLREQKRGLELQIQEEENQLIQVRQQMQMLESSLSWRITRPLRWMNRRMNVLKNLFQNSEGRNCDIEEPDKKEEEPFEKEQNAYEVWIEELERGYEKINIDKLEYQPKISILVPVYNVLDRHLIPCIESVLQQEYPNWELCLADDCSTWPNVREVLERYRSHERIKVVYRTENGHISESTNSALHIATGEFVAFLDCDDILAPNALSEVVKLLNEDRTLDFIYSDEDKIDDEGGNRHMPHFKSDWAPDTLMAHMYTCHLGVYRRSIAVEIGGERKGYEGAQDYDFTLRFTEKTDRIAHIPKILYHWRERKESTAGNPEAKPYILEAARKSKEDALSRRGLKAELELIDGIYQYRVNYIWDQYPKVSVIIPSKDNCEYLERCLKTFTEITKYADYELIVVDNGSTAENKRKYEEMSSAYHVKYVYEKKEFNFSYMCNVGALHAEGEYLLFLNDDVEIIGEEWLTRMVGQAMLPHTGAVGAKLLYPDKKSIQHVGVINIENGPVHAFAGASDESVYYFGRNVMDYNQLAVTAACLVVERRKFEEVNGFEEELAVAYNDVDFCFKLVERGYYNIVRNDAVLIHHESVSRGNDAVNKEKMKRLEMERNKLYARHPKFERKDPFYNPNLAQNTDDFSCNFGISAESYIQLEEKKKPSLDSADIRYSIDEINAWGADIRIRGWALVAGKDFESYREINILMKNEEGRWWEGKAYRAERLDVDKALQGNGKYRFAGFSCRIKKEELPSGTYVVGIRMCGKGIITEKKIEC